MIVVGALVAIAASFGPSGVASVESVSAQACAQPYSPWYEANLGIYDENPLVDLLGDSLDVSGWWTALDSDGDGTADVIEHEGEGVVITRGDGQVRLTPPTGSAASPTMSAGHLGDLNGDGRDEITVTQVSSNPGEGFAYQIDGTVAPGTYSVDEVGVRMPENVLLAPVGNQDGVAGVDLAVGYRSEGGVVSGAALLAPTIVTRDDADPAVSLAVHLADPIRVSTALEGLNSEPGSPNDPLLVTGVNAYRVAGERILTASTGFTRSGVTLAAWSLDDPCSRFDRAVYSNTVAPGAEPVSAIPQVTG